MGCFFFFRNRITKKALGPKDLESLYTGRTLASVPEGEAAGARGVATPRPSVGVNRCPCGENWSQGSATPLTGRSSSHCKAGAKWLLPSSTYDHRQPPAGLEDLTLSTPSEALFHSVDTPK